MIKQAILGVAMSYTATAQGAELDVEELRTKMRETSEYVWKTALGAMMLSGESSVCQQYYRSMESHRMLETSTEDQLRDVLPLLLDAKALAEEMHKPHSEEAIQAAFTKVIERCTL